MFQFIDKNPMKIVSNSKDKPKKNQETKKNQLQIERKLKQMSVAILFKCKLQKPPTVLVAQ